MKLPAFVVALSVLLVAVPSLPAADTKPVTKVTSTAEKKSKLLEEGEDSFKYRCEGIAGYDVIYEGAHGRTWVNLVYDSESTNLMDPLLNAAGGSFGSKADDKLIWRGTMIDGEFVPYAVLVRMGAMSDAGEQVQTFVVVQAAGSGSRVVGSVPASKGQKAAEALADKLCKVQ